MTRRIKRSDGLGRIVVDVIDGDTWEHFDELAAALQAQLGMQVVERVDGPDGSRRWILERDGTQVQLEYVDIIGITLRAETDTELLSMMFDWLETFSF